MGMIRIFKPTDTDFSNNGDIVIQPLVAKVHKEDNGDYYLNLECGLEYIDYIVPKNIIVAPTPTGYQAFRISTVEKTRTKLKAKVWHLSYDAKNYVIEDSYVVNLDCAGALDHLNSATDQTSPFRTNSDITTQDSYRCVRKSLYDAFSTVLERWGGHFVRDNYNVSIKQNIGTDNGVTVRYKKNLKEITCEENWDDVATKILPVGYDGLLLPEIYMSADMQYAIPFTKVISFDQDINEEDYEDETAYQAALLEDLRKQAEEYIEEYQYPQVNYTLKANLDKLTDIGDTVKVEDERLGIDVLTHVISFDWDCISERYTSVEFGNFTQKLSGLVGQISASIDSKTQEVKGFLQNDLEQATQKIWSVLGDSHVIYDGDKILIVDALPKEDAKNVILMNVAGIGFSTTGINGTFNTAWTIDGTFLADYIKAGTLQGITIKGNSLVGNTIQFGTNDNNLVTMYNDANGAYISGNGTMTFKSNTLIIDSTNFKLTADGTIAASNGTFSGKISASTISGTNISGGNISGTIISGSTIKFGTTSVATMTSVSDGCQITGSGRIDFQSGGGSCMSLVGNALTLKGTSVTLDGTAGVVNISSSQTVGIYAPNGLYVYSGSDVGFQVVRAGDFLDCKGHAGYICQAISNNRINFYWDGGFWLYVDTYNVNDPQKRYYKLYPQS